MNHIKISFRHLQEVDDYLRFNRTPVPLKRAVKDFYEYHYKYVNNVQYSALPTYRTKKNKGPPCQFVLTFF